MILASIPEADYQLFFTDIETGKNYYVDFVLTTTRTSPIIRRPPIMPGAWW